MIARGEVSDHEIADAVAAREGSRTIRLLESTAA